MSGICGKGAVTIIGAFLSIELFILSKSIAYAKTICGIFPFNSSGVRYVNTWVPFPQQVADTVTVGTTWFPTSFAVTLQRNLPHFQAG